MAWELTFRRDRGTCHVLAAAGEARRGPWVVLASAHRHSQAMAEAGLRAVEAGKPLESVLLPTQAVVAAINSTDQALEVVTSASTGSHLHFAQDADDAWVYSTSVPALLRALQHRPELDQAELLAYGLLTPRTRPPLMGVQSLLRGRRLLQREACTPTCHAWWMLDRSPARDAQDWVEQYCSLLDDVMRIELPESGDVSALMSAGLDSTMVVATAAGVMGSARGIDAMCLDPLPQAAQDRSSAGWLYSDLPDALAMEQRWPSVRVHGLRNDRCLTPMDVLPRVFELTGMPVLNPSNTVWMRVGFEAAAARGHEIMLTGQSGNLAYSWTPPPQRLGVFSGPGPIIDAMRSRARKSGNSVWFEVRSALVSRGKAVRPRRRPGELEHIGHPGFPLLRMDAIERLGMWDRMDQSPFSGSRPGGGWPRPGDLPSDLDLLVGLAPDVRFSDPLAAAPLVQLVAALPEAAFTGVGPDRSFARATAAGRVPDSIRLRAQRGRQAADAWQWFLNRPEWAAGAADLCQDPVVASLVDVDRWRAAWPSAEQPWTLGFDRTLGIALYARWYGGSADG